MDVWGTIVLFINVLLLFAGWLLFQQAKSDLTARAAQVPVLSEVKALQKSVAQLLEQLKSESIQTSAQLDTRCAEAKDLLAAIDRKLDEAERRLEETTVVPVRPSRKREPAAARTAARVESPQIARLEQPAQATIPAKPVDSRRELVYALTDDGVERPEIAKRTGLSEGEIELMLGLRAQVA